jgi:hypothetical protein
MRREWREPVRIPDGFTIPPSAGVLQCSNGVICVKQLLTPCSQTAHFDIRGDFLGAKKEEVLRQLRIVRKVKKMSYQNIVDGTEAIGAAVSMSSVRRVFDERFHADDFRYDTTIKPIVRVVMGIEEEFYEEPQTIEEATANVEGLVAVVDYKDAKIELLEAELAKNQKWLKALKIAAIAMGISLILCAMLLEAYIVLDIDHPEFGLLFR